MTELKTILEEFDPITLDEMDQVKLMNRTDTKFIFNIGQLVPVLDSLKKHFRILAVDGTRQNHYRTLYFDTPDFDFYVQHHNGKMNRKKIRMRKYMDSDLCFLEIKTKNNKGRTIKKRVRAAEIETALSDTSREFIDRFFPDKSPVLEQKLWISFTRLTLVHKTKKERLTIDFRLEYDNGSRQMPLHDLVIAEIKQEKFNAQSEFIREMKLHHIRQMRISKYCIGSTLLYKGLKTNRFKQKLLTINKIAHGVISGSGIAY